jgi:hypothetical protein
MVKDILMSSPRCQGLLLLPTIVTVVKSLSVTGENTIVKIIAKSVAETSVHLGI